MLLWQSAIGLSPALTWNCSEWRQCAHSPFPNCRHFQNCERMPANSGESTDGFREWVKSTDILCESRGSACEARKSHASNALVTITALRETLGLWRGVPLSRRFWGRGIENSGFVPEKKWQQQVFWPQRCDCNGGGVVLLTISSGQSHFIYSNSYTGIGPLIPSTQALSGGKSSVLQDKSSNRGYKLVEQRKKVRKPSLKKNGAKG